ncbi:YodC family protein [Luteibacter sp.]|jgi:uncharacterized protein YodC (DUF2158 family)|uniref:YodC family protein n=1 Tax=Luteibacter sp. TaxID=1886636 RepID=UPI002F4214DC
MADFKKGDVVQLKSGGPVMTVYDILGSGRVGCEWFDSKEQHQDKSFNSETLEHWKPASISLA